MCSVNIGWLRSPSCPPRPLRFKIFFATFAPPLRSSRLKALPRQSIVFFNYCGPAIAAIRFRHSFLTLAGGVANGVYCGRYIARRFIFGADKFSNSNLSCFDSRAGHCVLFLARFALSRSAEETAQRNRHQGQRRPELRRQASGGAANAVTHAHRENNHQLDVDEPHRDDLQPVLWSRRSYAAAAVAEPAFPQRRRQYRVGGNHGSSPWSVRQLRRANWPESLRRWSEFDDRAGDHDQLAYAEPSCAHHGVRAVSARSRVGARGSTDPTAGVSALAGWRNQASGTPVPGPVRRLARACGWNSQAVSQESGAPG